MRVRKSSITVIACVASWMFILTPVSAGDDASLSGAELVREGNRLLSENRFAEALTAYDKAAEQLPDSPEVAYNRGLALYRQGEFAKASAAFQNAIKPGRPEMEAKAKYNLGRCEHASAIDNRENLEEAVNELSRAIRFYQDALQVAPEDVDAKKNSALAERLMAFLQKKLEAQKQQEQEQKQDQPTSQPDEQQPPTSQPDQQQPTSQPTSQPQDKQQQGQQGEDKEEQQDQKQQGDKQKDKSEEGKKGKQKKQQQGEQPDERKQEGKQDCDQGKERKVMPREEAEAKLQEARDSERKRREAKREKEMRRQGLSRPDKDW